MKRLFRLVGLLCALGLLLAGCRADPPSKSEKVQVLLDGQTWDGAALAGQADDLRVFVTLDGAALIDLPFGEAHTVTVIQPDGAENVIAITGDSVSMQSANCENHDCVEMGSVTRDNLEMRVMGGFIICLPHKLSVEVRGH